LAPKPLDEGSADGAKTSDRDAGAGGNNARVG